MTTRFKVKLNFNDGAMPVVYICDSWGATSSFVTLDGVDGLGEYNSISYPTSEINFILSKEKTKEDLAKEKLDRTDW